MFVFTTSVFYIQKLALFFASSGTIHLFLINIIHVAHSLVPQLESQHVERRINKYIWHLR